MMKESFSSIGVSMFRAKALFLLFLCWLPFSAAAENLLLMAEEKGCYWCAKWNEEIGPIYPKTAEGRSAPLLRYDLHSETPKVTLSKPVHFTPTFLLISNGIEVGRIEGYPGEDFFWGLLSMLFDQADIPLEKTG